MKTLKIHSAEDIRCEEADLVQPGDGEVRIRVAYAGICGSDIHYYFEGANGAFEIREPFTPGHELSGTVDLDPSGALGRGTPITIHPAQFGPHTPGLESAPHLRPGGNYLGSASTWPHTQGGMSEYLIVKDFMVRPLPASLSLRTAALAEPLAVALHALKRSGGVEGKDVLVIGAGPIGQLVAAAAVAKGAASVGIADLLDGPLERAEHLGAGRTFLIGKADIPQARFGIVFECAGAGPAISLAMQTVAPAGTVVEVAMPANRELPVNLAPLPVREVTFTGSFRFIDEIDEAITLLDTRPEIAGVITHVFPAAEVVNAFAVAKDAAASGKVLVSLWHDADPGER
ncbi:MAG: alcohol dehydrogenase catalytic domain-containing protein [Propioniciclava sp.]|uniref:zinc-binding dehydrogenase n=1 Tax=Propioniciclava sp. TaxID=2038686 RepID=UPI0039E57806